MDNADLEARLAAMTARLDALESELAELRARSEEDIPEDVLIAISAAVAAYLGVKAKVKAVRFDRNRSWTQQGLQAVQRRQVPHVR